MKRQTIAFTPPGRANNLVDSDEVIREATNQKSSGTVRRAVISGCPASSFEEFEAPLALVNKFRFDAPGVFAYWLEPHTPAGQLSWHLPVQLANNPGQFPISVLGTC